MHYESLIYKREAGIGTVTLNRPDRLNSMDYKMLQELAHLLSEAREDDEIKALIFTGAGRAFCSGADVTSEIFCADPKQPGINRAFKLEPWVGFGTVMKRMRACHKPIIAAVNGMASGGGLSLICHCDIRIASDAARFCAIWVRRGVVADCGATFMLPRIIGVSKSLELMWTGDILDANDACKIGLVSNVVPADQLMTTASELASRIVKGPSIAIELMKKLVYDGLENTCFSAQMAHEAYAYEICAKTDDVKEAFKAFIEKRPPDFQGN